MKTVSLQIGDVCGTCGGRTEMHIGFWWWKEGPLEIAQYKWEVKVN
jgi:hypothetical protein